MEKPKNEKTTASQVFTIDENQWNHQIPGVTKLITADLGQKKKAASLALQLEADLAKYNVLFELRFESVNSQFIFKSIESYQNFKVAAWQKAVYEGMKIDLTLLNANQEFQEYDPLQHSFVFDTFAINPSYFVQVIKTKNTPDRVTVLVSKQSLIQKQKEIVNHCLQRN